MVLTKVSRTFPVRLDFELNKAFNAICVRHGDITYHIENALRAYIPTVQGDNSTLPVLAPVKPKTPAKRFTPPTPQEASNYFYERGSTDAVNEADKFIDHFSSNGWKVGGKGAMKDWKAAIRNWMRPRSGDTSQPNKLAKRLGDRSWAAGQLESD